jgi:hypothetical protein
MVEPDGKLVKINWKKDGSHAGNLWKPTASQADIDGEWWNPIARKADTGQKPMKTRCVKGETDESG